jgi:TusA-related sulfurtransferase
VSSPQVNGERWRQVGESWVRTLAERDFGRLALLCQPDVRGRLLTPGAFDIVDNAQALEIKFQQWFGKSDLVRIEQTQIQRVGGKLSIFDRLLLREQGEWFEVEQQISSFLREDLIGRLDLLCSGFQPVQALSDALTADAILLMNAASEAQGSTCAILTPAIKMRLREMASGQVLKVRVDDSTARGDIEAWCRLSGNELLAVTAAEGGQGLCFFLKKK